MRRYAYVKVQMARRPRKRRWASRKARQLATRQVLPRPNLLLLMAGRDDDWLGMVAQMIARRPRVTGRNKSAASMIKRMVLRAYLIG